MKLASKVNVWRATLPDQETQSKFDELTRYGATSTAGKAGEVKDDTAELSDTELGALIALVETAPTFPGADLAELNSELAIRTSPKVFDALDTEDDDEPAKTVSPILPATLPKLMPKSPPPKTKPVTIKPAVAVVAAPRGTLAERKDIESERAERLLLAGLDDLGGDGFTWQERADAIDKWFRSVKHEEAAAGVSLEDQWTALYAADRMTVRQVDSFSVRSQSFDVPRLHGDPKDQTIRLSNRALDILPRLDPANFAHANGGKSLKDKLGLHDLSGHLLDHTKPIKGQLKGYSNAIAIFMPVPSERDARILFALATLVMQGETLEDRAKARQAFRAIRSELTRIKLAQGSDMHTSFVDIGAFPNRPMFRYGLTGTVTLVRGQDGITVDEADIAKRRHDAVEFSKILGPGAVENANEIVLSYRRHQSGRFPLFAEWDDRDRCFHFVTLKENPAFAAYAEKVEKIREALGEYVATLPEGTVLSDSDIPEHLREPSEAEKVSRYVTTRTGDAIDNNGKWKKKK